MPVPSVVASAVTTAAALLAAGTFAVIASAAPPVPDGESGGPASRGAPPPLGSGRPAGQRPAAAAVPVAVPRRPAARFRWPLNPTPRVLRAFAVGPYRWSPGHRGVDLAAVGGQTVLAAGPGVVAFAGRVAGRGVVVVAHGEGLRTTYEPVIPGVRLGQAVGADTPIARLEAVEGHCAGPCLHWGALRGEVYVDPLSLLRRGGLPVLLPLDDESLSGAHGPP